LMIVMFTIYIDNNKNQQKVILYNVAVQRSPPVD
jgi:hypothetical protein